MLTPEASKALAPPGPPLPRDRVSWSRAPVTPHPNPPSPPGTPSWPTDLLEPHPRVSRPSTSCSADPTGPPFVSHLQSAALQAPPPSPPPQNRGLLAGQPSAVRSRLADVLPLWPPPPFARALPSVRPRPPGGSPRLGGLGAPTSAPPGGPRGSGSTTRCSAGASAAGNA